MWLFRIVFFLAVALTSSALIIERMEGLLDRSWVAGVTPVEILFSHVVTQFVVMCGQTALVLIFMILVFGVKCNGGIGWVIVLTILQGLCGMCFGKLKLLSIWKKIIIFMLFIFFRFRYFGNLRTGKERHSIGLGQLLPNSIAQR